MRSGKPSTVYHSTQNTNQMKKIFFFLLLSLFMLSKETTAQSKSTFAALNQFLNTQFFEDYLELRNRSEKAVRGFKAIQHQYSEEEVQLIIDSYNASANYFNSTLVNIKQDLLNRSFRKFLVEYPDKYSKQVEADLFHAKEFYANTFQREIATLTNGQITGAGFLALLPQVMKYIKLSFGVFNKIKAEIKKFNNGLLDKYLIDKYRFRSWEEIK